MDKSILASVLQQRSPASLMEAFRQQEYQYLLYAPERDVWSGYFKSNYVSIIRPIMNIYSMDVVGVVEVQQNIKLLDAYIRTSPQSNMSVNIYDEAGNPVLLQADTKDVVVASAVSERCGWRVELLEEKSVAQGAKLRLQQTMMVAWLALTAVVVVVIGLIAARISRPLTMLTSAVRKTDIAAPKSLPLIPTKVDEIIALQTAFNQVIESLTFSLEQEKKSFLLAMQAQMNPHFLYNVLSVIHAVALEGKSDVVVGICGNLSGMLRYSSSYEKGTATVAEELQHTRAYLDLMKARYEHMFQYSIQVDADLEDIIIPKLVIQPMCENAFAHPFAEIEPPYILNIRLQKERDGWSLEVVDNGKGFARDVRESLLQRANETGYQDLDKMQIGGLGLVSSVLRLKLITKHRVVCDIQDAEPCGAIVKLYILDETI